MCTVWYAFLTEKQVWGGTRAEADDKMHDFFESPYFLDGLPVVEGAAEVLRKHSETLELHVVTSRTNVLTEHTVWWIDANYPGVFADLHFGNHYGQGVARSKPDLCRAIDAVMMIDDNMHYATQCAEAGIRTCLFGERRGPAAVVLLFSKPYQGLILRLRYTAFQYLPKQPIIFGSAYVYNSGTVILRRSTLYLCFMYSVMLLPTTCTKYCCTS